MSKANSRGERIEQHFNQLQYQKGKDITGWLDKCARKVNVSAGGVIKIDVNCTAEQLVQLDRFLFSSGEQYKIKATINKNDAKKTANKRKSPQVLFLSEKSHTSNRWKS